MLRVRPSPACEKSNFYKNATVPDAKIKTRPNSIHLSRFSLKVGDSDPSMTTNMRLDNVNPKHGIVSEFAIAKNMDRYPIIGL